MSELEAFFGSDARRLVILLIAGGLLSLYVRWLYNRCGSSVSDTDAISGVFPILTIVTIAVISVVKASLALSLGLVGALSIVRFRAAIKDPEELVYLFMCIAIGLALGAGRLATGIYLVVIASAFILGRHHFGIGKRRQSLMLTVSGAAERYFDTPASGALATVQELAGDVQVQRYDVEEGQGLLRVAVKRTTADETAHLIAELRARLPECRISCVNLDTVL